MDKKLFSLGSGVILDRCLQCKGVWLDNGEIEKIQEALHPPPAPYRQAALASAPQAIAIHFDIVQQVQMLQRDASK